MANKKINELDVRATLSLSDLMIVGDPSSGYAYKTSLADLQTLISTEADTLDTVTGRGNTTTNSITIGAANISGSLSALNGLFNINEYDTGSGGLNKSSYAELKSYNNDGYGDGLSIQYSRGTVTTPAAVQTNDLLGGVYFKGYNGTNNQLLNYIEAIVTGYGTHPKTKLVFTTTNGNDTYSYISMILDPDGRLFLGYNVEDKGPSYRLIVDGGVWATGALVSSLAGTGTRMVVADSTGVLSTQAIPSVSDGDKGDITVSGSGATWTIDNGVIGVSKLSATGTPSATTYLRGDNTWATVSGGGGTPAGANTQIQYNNSGAFGASAGLVYDDSIGKMSLSKNHNGQTYLSISNTTAGSIANSGIAFTSNSGVNIAQINLTSTSTTPYKAVASGDLSIYKTNSGDITFQHDFGTGKIKFAMGGASTAQMTLTAAGRLLLGTTTEGSNLLDVNGGVNIVGVANIIGGLIVDTNTLSVDAVNNRVGVGTSSPLAQLNINQLAGTTKGIFISGDEIYASGNGGTSQGVRIGLGVSRTSNRQLWMGDNDAFGSSTLSIFRYQTGITGYAALDAVTGDGLTRLTTILGSDTSKVGVGYNDAGFISIGAYTAKLNVFTSGTETTTNLLIAKRNTATGLYIDVQDAAGSSKIVLTNAGRFLIGTSTEGASILRVIGLPTSSAGLSAGDIWNDGGTLKIV